MGTTVPNRPIGSALFGVARQAVLRLLYGRPGTRFYQRQIVRELSLGHGAVQRELARLAACGLLLRIVEGRQTYYQANPDSPVFRDLRSLVQKTFGVADVLRGALAPLAGHIRVAFVFGSVAQGVETENSDVDLLIVSDAIRLADVVAALREAQEALGREVNPSVYRSREFSRKLIDGHYFVTHVAAAPKLFVLGSEDELAGLGKARLDQAASGKPRRDRRIVRHRRS